MGQFAEAVGRSRTTEVQARRVGSTVSRVRGSDAKLVLITNLTGSVSLWKAADLTPLGSFPTGAATVPYGACSDGVNVWVTLASTNQLARF